MPRYSVLSPISKGKRYLPGDTVTLTEEEAAELTSLVPPAIGAEMRQLTPAVQTPLTGTGEVTPIAKTVTRTKGTATSKKKATASEDETKADDGNSPDFTGDPDGEDKTGESEQK